MYDILEQRSGQYYTFNKTIPSTDPPLPSKTISRKDRDSHHKESESNCTDRSRDSASSADNAGSFQHNQDRRLPSK